MNDSTVSQYFIYPFIQWTLEKALENWHRFFASPPERVLTGEDRYLLGPWPDDDEREADALPNG